VEFIFLLLYHLLCIIMLQIVFDFPYEVLTHVTGYYGSLMYMGPAVIRSLTFHTTKKSYGPLGDEHGTYFTTKLREGKVVGFHGRSGLFLDSLGVHAIEGKVIVPVAAPPSMEIISREPTVTEIDNPQLAIVAKSAPIEQVFVEHHFYLRFNYSFDSYTCPHVKI